MLSSYLRPGLVAASYPAHRAIVALDSDGSASAANIAPVPAFEAAVVLRAARVLIRCDPMPIASRVLTSGHAGRRRPGRIALCVGGVGGQGQCADCKRCQKREFSHLITSSDVQPRNRLCVPGGN